jgi:hypothetical protein
LTKGVKIARLGEPKIRASERYVHLLDINIVLKVECRDVTLDLLFWA